MNTRTARTIHRGLAAGLLGLLGPVVSISVAPPPASAEPTQGCDTTVGDSVNFYLTRHPSIKEELTKRGEQESPGSPNALLDYLNRHPDVRQALITLSQQCVP